MSGLLRRLKRRRPATADENVPPAAASSEPVAAPAETPAEPGGQSPVPADQPTVILPATTEQPAVPLPAWTVAADQPTAFAAQPAPARDLPAGVDPHDLATAPVASSRRGKLRRRLRYLRHVRELLLRDLGGFTYEVHRTAGGTAHEPQRRLTAAKAQRLAALDAEVLALESRLGEPHAEAVLREPGIGGTCHECGELHASDAHFCSRCGAPLDAKARAQRAAEQPTTGSQAVVEPQPASVLWAGGPRPAPEPREEEKETPEPPSSVTSQWLASDRPTTFERPPKPAQAAPVWPAAKPDDEPSATTPAEPATKPDEPSAPAAEEPATKPDEPSAPAPDEPATKPADQPSATAPDEPKPADEPATAVDEPSAPAPDATPADEPTAAEPAAPPAPATAAARAKPKRASKPRKPAKRAPAKPKPEADEPGGFAANGRRDEDVPPPLSSGDPLAAPREQKS